MSVHGPADGRTDGRTDRPCDCETLCTRQPYLSDPNAELDDDDADADDDDGGGDDDDNVAAVMKLAA